MRQNPDYLLQSIDIKNEYEGQLKIFFGYAAGVGKTMAMLKAGHIEKSKGVDIVVGYIEPHDRISTMALVKGLPVIPNKEIIQKHVVIHEFDLDSALIRKPKLILVDELAHTNAIGSRNMKRYQDIQELLKAGIDVYTTVNVQHIESLNDIVASITNIVVKERIPDSIFDKAHQIELVDIEPIELIERLKKGQIYQKEQARRAIENFFTIEKLTALREIALRRCADRMNLITDSTRIQNHRDYYIDEHILVCLSSSPTNAKIIRTAARMVNAFKSKFTALFVQTTDYETFDELDKKRLLSNIHLAEQLGAHIETVYGEDISYQIAQYARLVGVSKIVIGQSKLTRRHFYEKMTLTERLIDIAPNVDIHIIPDLSITVHYKNTIQLTFDWKSFINDLVISSLFLVGATICGYFFSRYGFIESNTITIYILAVLLASLLTSNRICSLVNSFISVLIYDFLFTEPIYTFVVYDQGHMITFVIMFISAFITSTLAMKLKGHAKQSARSAYRTKILFETSQLLQKTDNDEEMMTIIANQLLKLLNKTIVVYLEKDGILQIPKVIKNDLMIPNEIFLTDKERSVAQWVLVNKKHAGATTDTLSYAQCLYLAIRINQHAYGIVGIHITSEPLESFEKSVLLAILDECALAIENSRNAQGKKQADLLAQNEHLRANLLRAISHDLRTPLTSISGNASNLISNKDDLDENTKIQIYTDIYDDSIWLINLVENLLSVTRIEEGKMNFKFSVELVDELIREALSHVKRKKDKHTIQIESNCEDLFVQIDARLVIQVIINILDNAIRYTPTGSTIFITTEKKKDKAFIHIADDGLGIDDEAKMNVFDRFYTGPSKIVDNRRSLGLGLFLCKSIVNALGGEIYLCDNVPHGCIFSFSLPLKEIEI